MPSIATLPAPGPFERVVDVRVFPHGFTTRQGDTTAGPAGSAIVRPNLENDAWHAAASQKWGGNIVWTGSTPRHTVAYNGPRAYIVGRLSPGGGTVRRNWLAYNGQQITVPAGVVMGAAVKTYAGLATTQTYTGAGNGALAMQTPAATPGALTGTYEVRCITAGPIPRFLVTGPDAQPVGVAEAGPAAGAPILFDGVLRFNLQSGVLPFAVGDRWLIAAEEPTQLVAITEDSSKVLRVYRRGVSLTGAWLLLLTIPASVWHAGEIVSGPQRWDINASATRAVTTRWVPHIRNAGGNITTEGYVVYREIDLDDLTHSVDTAMSLRWGYTETYTELQCTEGETSGGTPMNYLSEWERTRTSLYPEPQETVIGRYFDGDTLVPVSLRLTQSWAAYTHYLSLPVPAPLDMTASETVAESHALDLLVGPGGSVLSVRVSDGSFSWAGTDSSSAPATLSFSSSYTTRTVWAVTQDFGHALQQSSTVSDASTSGATGTRTTQSAWHFDAAVLESSTATAGISFEPTQYPNRPIWECGALAGTYVSSGPVIRNLEAGWLFVEPAGAGGHPAMQADNYPLDTSAVTGRTGVAHTSAMDARGNWLLLGKSPTTPLTLWTGGPDSLTAATVATVTGHDETDTWGIGAF